MTTTKKDESRIQASEMKSVHNVINKKQKENQEWYNKRYIGFRECNAIKSNELHIMRIGDQRLQKM